MPYRLTRADISRRMLPTQAREPDPQLPQPEGDLFFCGCLECRQYGKFFVSRSTWFRHDAARTKQIQEDRVPPPHPSYRQPRKSAQEGPRKRQRTDTVAQSHTELDISISSTTDHIREGPGDVSGIMDLAAHRGESETEGHLAFVSSNFFMGCHRILTIMGL